MSKGIERLNLLYKIGFKTFHCEDLTKVDEIEFKNLFKIGFKIYYPDWFYSNRDNQGAPIFVTKYNGNDYFIAIKVILKFCEPEFKKIWIVKEDMLDTFFNLLKELDMKQITDNIINCDIDYTIENVLINNNYREVTYVIYELLCKDNSLYTILKTMMLFENS